MQLDGFITIVVDAANLETAKLVMQAFDPDAGGYDSFAPVTAGGLYVCCMPATPAIEEQFNRLKDRPAQLTQFVRDDIDARFNPTGYALAEINKDAARKKRYDKVKRADIDALLAAWIVDNRDLRKFAKIAGIDLTPATPQPL